jgi:3-oxoacyl-[acyl-carrier-protein] synthase-1
MVIPAVREVIAKISGENPVRLAIPLLLALPEPRPGFGPEATKAVVRAVDALDLGGMVLKAEAVATGHAGALRALQLAVDRLARRDCELCLVGGVDSYLDVDMLDWMEAKGFVARANFRGGFIPGEAAGMLALTTRTVRSRLRLPSLARVRGVATATEPRPFDGVDEQTGQGLAAAVQGATQSLRPPAERVDAVFNDINGNRQRGDEWALVALRCPEVFRDASAYASAVGSWGDVGAAWGALGCVLAVQSWRRGYAVGPRALVCGSSPGGLRGAALLESDART